MRKNTLNAFLFFFVIYAPLFGQMFLGFRENSKTVSYGIVFLFLCALFFRALNHRFDIMPYWIMVLLCLCFIGIGIFHLVFGTDRVSDFLYQNYGYVLSLSLLAYLATFKDLGRQIILEKIFALVGIAFLFQFCISAYEASLGYYIAAQAEWLNSGTYTVTLSNRFLLNVLSPNIGGLMFGNVFFHPLSGLLGQHNYWGTQLPFYNLIFLLMYLQKGERKYLVLLFFVCLAILLNTSRFGIAAILLTYLVTAIYIVKFSKFKRMLVVAISGLSLALLIIFSPILLERASQYFKSQDTLTYRLTRYPALAKTFTLSSIVSVLLGNSTSEVSDLISKSRVVNTSLEAQVLSTLYNQGVIGLGISIFCLVIFFVQVRKMPKFWRLAGYLLLLNIFCVSLISDLVFHYSSLVFVTLLYVYILIGLTQDRKVDD